MELEKINSRLINELIALIEEGKKQIAYAGNATTTLTYWNIGKRINSEVLENKVCVFNHPFVKGNNFF
jgi:hypothetical protein